MVSVDEGYSRGRGTTSSTHEKPASASTTGLLHRALLRLAAEHLQTEYGEKAGKATLPQCRHLPLGTQGGERGSAWMTGERGGRWSRKSGAGSWQAVGPGRMMVEA